MRPNIELIHALSDGKLLELLSDLEHKRWANWQKYVHEKCSKNPDGSLTIPKESVEWWESEIATPYKDLTEAQKESDRREVREFLELAIEYLSEKI